MAAFDVRSLDVIGPGDAGDAAGADVVGTFWGGPRRLAATTRMHQCGSAEEAKAAAHAGADALIVQGVEAGGHARGKRPLLAPHRVIPNAATRRRLRADRR